MSALKYRPDIDGMRAVAVLGVVIYHAFPWMIPGGFIGVDIFFVISGYLISGILYKGHKEDDFSFQEFYSRRIRRLFPALITVLMLCLAYGWLILMPEEFQQLGKHMAAGTLFIQNIIFWQESGYFDTAASLKPLLHLWSLAVEEQFYIFFPPILLLVWKRKWSLVLISIILLIVSFLVNLVMSRQSGVADFFLTPYRAWEFLGGSLLAWWHYDRGHENEEPTYRDAFSCGGIAFLVLGFAFIKTGDSYPGWRAILPVAGTLLLMEGGAGGLKGAWVNRKILSNPVVIWIGLISYPLYLFHWPILSFVHTVKGESPKPGYLFIALTLSVLLAALTYYFVEKKLRHHKSRLTVPALFSAFIITGLLGFLAWQKVLMPRPLPSEMIKIKLALEDKDSLRGLVALDGPKDICVDQIGGEGKRTLFFGDSNMQQYAPRIVELLKSNHGGAVRGALFVTRGGWPPIPDVTRDGKVECPGLFPELESLLKNNNEIDRVVIAARWDIYFSKETNFCLGTNRLSVVETRKKTLERFGKLIRDLVVSGKSVTVVLNTPNDGTLDPKHYFKRNFFGSYSKTINPFSKQEHINKNGVLENEIAAMALTNGAEIIDPLDSLCINGICIAENEDGPIRYDINHLRPGYVSEHIHYLDRTVAP